MSTLRSPLRLAPSGALSAVPGVWHADALGAGLPSSLPSGYAALDAQLPGGGWPVGALSEVLQPVAGLHEWQLVLPALARAVAQRPGAVVAVAPPCEPFGPALQAQGLPAQRLCVVQPDQAGQRSGAVAGRAGTKTGASSAALWAAEQALRCSDVLAVLVWLPQVAPAALRRLQLAAAQHQQLLWVFRPLGAAAAQPQQSLHDHHHQASPALLRLQVQGVERAVSDAVSAGHQMQVHILKRRGPPLAQALVLPGCHPALAQVLAAQAERRRLAQQTVARQQAAVQARRFALAVAKAPAMPAVPVAAAAVAWAGVSAAKTSHAAGQRSTAAGLLAAQAALVAARGGIAPWARLPAWVPLVPAAPFAPAAAGAPSAQLGGTRHALDCTAFTVAG